MKTEELSLEDLKLFCVAVIPAELYSAENLGALKDHLQALPPEYSAQVKNEFKQRLDITQESLNNLREWVYSKEHLN